MESMFDKMAAAYAAAAASAQILPERLGEVMSSCRRLMKDVAVYRDVEAATSVPAAAIMALSEREMTGRLDRYLGNGQRLDRRTTWVPKGRGPFPSFKAGAIDALTLDGLTKVARQGSGWTLARFCYESESWNGWGYRARGIRSPYVFGATTAQQRGKFTADHVFDRSQWDEQVGTLALVRGLVSLDASLQFWPKRAVDASDPPPVEPHPMLGKTDAAWVQRSLNALRGGGTPLIVDDNYGRDTSRAVKSFQQKHGLVADGLAGPKTIAAIKDALAAAGL